MFDPKQFATAKAKPLPVYLLLDVSGSMRGDKIDNLNNAVREMIISMADEEKMEVEILISIITVKAMSCIIKIRANCRLICSKCTSIFIRN